MRLIRGKHFERVEYPQTPSSPPYIELRLKRAFFIEVTTLMHVEFLERIKKECYERNLKFEYEERGDERIVRLIGIRTQYQEHKPIRPRPGAQHYALNDFYSQMQSIFEKDIREQMKKNRFYSDIINNLNNP